MPDDPWDEPLTSLAIDDALEVVPARLRKALEAAQENGWELGPTGCTAVMRLYKPGDTIALPFFVRWDLVKTKGDKWSWRFHGSMAQNGQRMNYNDIFSYIEDPQVIYPEPPSEDGND